jgi:predicted GNAT superfamily acetyltransferase
MSENIFLANDDKEIRKCYPVMVELRPHVKPDEFVARVKRQQELAAYKLAFITNNGAEGDVKAVAGFRISECLAWGKFLYVDDLVSKSGDRSKGYGGTLFDWLVEYARKNECDQFHLDSAVHRFAAHRFYLLKRMEIEGHHFGLKLNK